MQRTTITVGAFDVNCSIIDDGANAWIVDPGSDAYRIADFLGKRHLKPSGILLTHGHFDHIGGIPSLQETFPDLPVYVHQSDVPAFTHPMNCYPPDYPSIEMPKNIMDAHATGISGLEVIDTPGHTPGSVCYHFPSHNLLLSGDTLFAGSAGRTDLPGGNCAALMRSLAILKELPEETVVVPGHGPETTIGAERRSNPFLS